MPRVSDKRERLIHSADRLILKQGFRQTTLADIADDADVPLGNVYYYFKTKEAIGAAVIETRLLAMQAVLRDCERFTDPRARLLAFLDYPLEFRGALTAHGCPLGSLSYELSHTDGSLRSASGSLIDCVLQWSREQFESMGRADAGTLALQFVGNLQGMILIANSLNEPTVIDTLVAQTRAWLSHL